MFITPCFIRKNNKELRGKLKTIGYKILLTQKMKIIKFYVALVDIASLIV